MVPWNLLIRVAVGVKRTLTGTCCNCRSIVVNLPKINPYETKPDHQRHYADHRHDPFRLVL